MLVALRLNEVALRNERTAKQAQEERAWQDHHPVRRPGRPHGSEQAHVGPQPLGEG